MTIAETFCLSALLIAGVAFTARLCIESDPIDVLALTGVCTALGYLWGAQ